jgi:fucose permease
VADEFGRQLGDLGLIVLVIGLAYAAASSSIGRLSRFVSARTLLIVAAGLGASSLAAFSVSDVWAVLVVAAIPLGISGGIIDAVGNGFVASNESARVMGFIHAAFALGAMLAPLLIAVIAVLGGSWRTGFAILALAETLLALGFWFWAGPVRLPMEGRRDAPRRFGSPLLLGLSVWVFFAYAAVEGNTGLWAFTLLTEGQGAGDAIAGLAVAAHWGALFASRLLLGFAGDRVDANRTIGVSTVGIVLGLVLLWWHPSTAVAVAGLILAGFASGPVFPLEMLLTPARFGTEYTGHVAGYQLAAATASIAVTPAIIGWIVNQWGPLTIGGSLVVLGVITAVSVEILRWRSDRERPASEATPTARSTPER